MTMNKPIQVWAWEDAPAEFKALSSHGGDEDWVALIPKEFQWKMTPMWLEEPHFGNDVSHHELPDGSVIHISAHA